MLAHDLATYRTWGERAKPTRVIQPVPWTKPVMPNWGALWRTLNLTESAYALIGWPDWPGNDEALSPKVRWKVAHRLERSAFREASKDFVKGGIGSLYGARMYRSSEV